MNLPQGKYTVLKYRSPASRHAPSFVFSNESQDGIAKAVSLFVAGFDSSMDLLMLINS